MRRGHLQNYLNVGNEIEKCRYIISEGENVLKLENTKNEAV